MNNFCQTRHFVLCREEEDLGPFAFLRHCRYFETEILVKMAKGNPIKIKNVKIWLDLSRSVFQAGCLPVILSNGWQLPLAEVRIKEMSQTSFEIYFLWITSLISCYWRKLIPGCRLEPGSSHHWWEAVDAGIMVTIIIITIFLIDYVVHHHHHHNFDWLHPPSSSPWNSSSIKNLRFQNCCMDFQNLRSMQWDGKLRFLYFQIATGCFKCCEQALMSFAWSVLCTMLEE